MPLARVPSCRGWAVAVGLTVGVSVLAGCGSTVRLGVSGPISTSTTGVDGVGAPTVTGPAATTPTDVSRSANGANTGLNQGQSGVTGGGSVGPASLRNGSVAAGPSVIPATGSGWTKTTAYIGVPYQDSESSSAALSAFGFNGIGFIDHRAIAKAVIADINKHGGLFGRQLQPIFANFPAVAATGQSQCAAWTQDNHVFAVTDSFYDTTTIYGCLAKAKVPFSNSTIAATNDTLLGTYGPYFRKLNVTSAEKLHPVWLTRLAANGYFSGWNTTTGASGSAPVKLGMLCRDDYPATLKSCDLLAAQIRKRGYDLASTFHVSGGADQTSGAVIKFKSAGVTHVFSETTDILFFMTNANQQGYRPRYALTSLNALNVLLATNAPAQQLVGSLGVGFAPYADVNNPPAIGKGQEHCMKVLDDAGQGVKGTSQKLQAQSICDGIYLYVLAARLGGGLSPDAILHGMRTITTLYQSANTFATGFSPTRFDEAAAARDFGWDTGCKCFKYLSTTNYPS